jgi:hypothetical protein
MATVQTQGTLFQVETTDSPSTFTTVGEVVGFDGPSGTANMFTTTNLSSTAVEKNVGLPDYGAFSLSINYDPASTSQDYIWSAFTRQTTVNVKVTLTNSPAETWTATCYVTAFSHRVQLDSVVGADITLEITGAVTKA